MKKAIIFGGLGAAISAVLSFLALCVGIYAGEKFGHDKGEEDMLTDIVKASEDCKGVVYNYNNNNYTVVAFMEEGE